MACLLWSSAARVVAARVSPLVMRCVLKALAARLSPLRSCMWEVPVTQLSPLAEGLFGSCMWEMLAAWLSLLAEGLSRRCVWEVLATRVSPQAVSLSRSCMWDWWPKSTFFMTFCCTACFVESSSDSFSFNSRTSCVALITWPRWHISFCITWWSRHTCWSFCSESWACSRNSSSWMSFTASCCQASTSSCSFWWSLFCMSKRLSVSSLYCFCTLTRSDTRRTACSTAACCWSS
mmetsp:Transcript_149414/g.416445  ORF Transcript_149414/g.416445 Transcript_149414/m.416445 type:complete len:234 (-) Transcript_149414:490-1191(-)